MLRTLQAGRAIAALAVLAYHLNHQLAVGAGMASIRPLEIGWCGVDFFFVLSGFIIAWVHGPDLGQPDRAGRYLWNRFARLYPVYWIVLAGVLALFFAAPGLGEPGLRRPAVIVASVLLVPFAPATVIGQAWTLYHEVLFYGLFWLAIVRPRIGFAIMAVWFMACLWRVSSRAPLWNEIDSPLAFVTSPLNLLFALGMGTALVLRRRPPARPWLTAGVGLGLFAALVVAMCLWRTDGEPALVHLGLGLGAAIAVLGLCAAELQGRARTPGLLFALGGASYSIYLTHTFVISLGSKLSRQVAAPLWMSFAALALGAVVAGWLFSRVVEQPLLRRLRRRRDAVI